MLQQKKIEQSWEERSKILKANKRAVLEQSFPPKLLDYMHNLHIAEVLSVVEDGKSVCLDLGCGYGRIAREIVLRKPKTFVYGIDISKTFVALFNKILHGRGQAIHGNFEKLPFEKNMFDYAWSIVSFMYIDSQKQQATLNEMMRVLKPGGKLILIEPNSLGYNLIKLWGILPWIYRSFINKKKIESFGTVFVYGRIEKLIRASRGKLLLKKGYPVFTLLLIPLIILGKLSIFPIELFLAIINHLDKKLCFSRFSYVITYVVQK